jgi:diguanylate cyclase (GGDEF)-like protein/PAS domain S-box-containing protein
MLYFIIIPILFSSILLSFAFTAGYVGAVITGMFLFDAFVPGLPPGEVPTITTVMIGGLALLAAGHRSRVEKDRLTELTVSEERFRRVVQNAQEGFIVIDDETNRVLNVNKEACRLFGLKVADCRNRGWREIVAQIARPRDDAPDKCVEEDSYNCIDNVLGRFEYGIKRARSGEQTVFEIHVPSKEDKISVWTAKFATLPSKDGQLININLLDITAQREKEKELQFLATHDNLTKLPNRALFLDRLENAVERGQRQGGIFAIILLDIDNFKHINDAFGHPAGDELLCTVGKRLGESLRKTDTIARLGGDEFAVILEQLISPLSTVSVVEKLMESVIQTIIMQEREINVTASLGISIYPEDSPDADELIQHADAALYHAKGEGKNSYAFYDEVMTENIAERLSISHELRTALDRDQFYLEYQPQIHIKTGSVECFEALIRWNHPARGRVSPGQFLPIAEETGIIRDIGEWVIYTAAEQLAQWHKDGFTDLRVAVNVAQAQLLRGKIVRRVEELLRYVSIPLGSLELELTENILFRDIEESARLIRQLQELGVRVVMDDFGAGYSTLHHLTALPLDVLKIDQKFARWIIDETKNKAVVRGIGSIARDLGIPAVAEGIETEEQLEFFSSAGFTVIQGYYFSRPIPAEQCLYFLRELKEKSI